jgi:hypothetical protein
MLNCLPLAVILGFESAIRGWELYAPGAILTEVLFILCKKLQDGLMTIAEHQTAIASFRDYMKRIRPSPQGEIGFIERASVL